MSIEDLAIDIESSYEGSLCEEIPTKKEREDSRKFFVDGLKKAVMSGGKVIIEWSCGVELFYFRENNKPTRWSISKSDAIEFCGLEK